MCNKPKSQTLYEKIGNKYVPVSEYVAIEHWRKGSYLVQVMPGYRSITRMVFPKSTPEVEATLKIMAEAILKRMQVKSVDATTNKQKKLTRRQRKVMEDWGKAFGDAMVWLPSRHEVVQDGVDAIRNYWNNAKED